MDSRIARNERFLRNIYEKGPFEGHAFCVNPPSVPVYELPHGDYTVSREPIREWVPWVVENYARQVEMLQAVGDDSVPCAKLGTGTQLYAAAFGCEVRAFDDNNPFALHLVTTADEADEIAMPDIWSTPELYRVFELGRLVQEELGVDVCLGPCDMQSGFDTAGLIWRKQDFLIAMMDEQDRRAVKRLVDKCALLYKNFLIELRKEFPRMSPCHCPAAWAPPEMPPWLSNDECGAVGSDLFVEFILPELVDLSETFEGLGMHCCAAAEHQFELFKQIPGFYAFNRVPASQGWDPILEHFGGPDATVHVLAWITEAAVEDLIARAPAGTRFIIVGDAQTPDDGMKWYERMRALSPRVN